MIQMKRGVLVYLLVASFVSPMGLTLAGIFYTNTVDNRTRSELRSQQEDIRLESRKGFLSLCKVLANSDRPPPTGITDPELRRRIVENNKDVHQLRIDLRCITK